MTETMQEAATRLGVTVEITKDRGIQRDAQGWEHHAYLLTVTFGSGASIVTPWSQGLGIESSPTEEPATILDSLVQDCTDEDFDTWADEYGYDTDSRKAYATWEACRMVAARLIATLGEDEVSHLRHEVEAL